MGKLAVLVFIAVVAIGLAYGINEYNNTIYRIDRAKGFLSRAEGAGNLISMRGYLMQAREKIDSYSGNPVWIYPTENTNFDLIKEGLNENIEYAELLGNETQEAQTQGMDDIRGKIREFKYQLTVTRDWLFWYKPLNIAIFAVLIVVAFISFICIWV